MAIGWRRWGRRGELVEEVTAKDGATTGRPRALHAIDDLMRRAEWPQIPARERTALLHVYPRLQPPEPDAAIGEPGGAPDAQTQDWLADLLAPHLQPAGIAVIRTWLEASPPNTHLYLLGPSGRARTSVVAALARRATAERPPAPDYCYAPDPRALAHSVLLALPSGRGVAFADALGTALRQILVQWEKVRDRARGEPGEEADDEATRRRLVRTHLSPVEAAVEVAGPYLRELTAALEGAASIPLAPQVAEVDAPAGRPVGMPPLPTDASSGEDTANHSSAPQPNAPVIVASLARMDLARTLVRANGGVLLLSAADLVDRDQPNSDWATLRAALRAGSIPMRGTSEPSVPLATRVALIGSYSSFRVLERAEDFLRLFRYKARFEESAEWSRDGEAAYAALADGISRLYSTPPLDDGAIEALVEEGARRVGDRNRSRLTTDVLTLRDVAVEAGRRAQAAARAAASGGNRHGEALADVTTTRDDVSAALAARRMQQGALARDSREAILVGREIVPTTGAAVGQINGLGVAPMHPAEGRYATPFRVTATVSPGRERLVDIEREAEVADPSHISGALTMSGYLAWRYGGKRPISVVARLRFEQEHGYVSGPSASAAELFALLSALSGVPIRASLAVTGAVGQHGELQLIGGVNEKIEGFWQICRERRAQGERPEGAYGVIMPAANVGDVMLREDVAEAIARGGWFHIWPIEDVDEGLPLLTGVSAQVIHSRVHRALQRFYELALRDLDTH